MGENFLLKEVKKLLHDICVDIGERLTGSDKNKQMEDYAASYFEKEDFNVELQNFSCIDWKNYGADYMLFVMNQIPTIALTSKDIFNLIDKVIHTKKDNLNLVDYKEVVKVIKLIEKIVKRL